MMKQYETLELVFSGKAPEGSEACVDLKACIKKDGKSWQIKGFYAGEESYKVRFLPEECGEYDYEVSGSVLSEVHWGSFTVEPADSDHHGPVHASRSF